jgi:hypothetical protein
MRDSHHNLAQKLGLDDAQCQALLAENARGVLGLCR